MQPKKVPFEHFNNQLRLLGRWLDHARFLAHGWKGGEYGIQILWPDGYQQFVGFGEVASAVIDSTTRTAH